VKRVDEGCAIAGEQELPEVESSFFGAPRCASIRASLVIDLRIPRCEILPDDMEIIAESRAMAGKKESLNSRTAFEASSTCGSICAFSVINLDSAGTSSDQTT